MIRNRDATKVDFSSFMCIILMLTGSLVTILISNIFIIATNPSNVEISSILTPGLEEEEETIVRTVGIVNGNVIKDPWYIEVMRDQIVIYPGEIRVGFRELEDKGNPFEKMLERVVRHKDNQYIVLLVRPYASALARQLKKKIVEHRVDVGMDLLEKDVPIVFVHSTTNLQVAAGSL